MTPLNEIVLARAKTQLADLRLDVDEPDSWGPARRRRCAECGGKLSPRAVSPLCAECMRPAKRERCLAGDCDEPVRAYGYCARHRAHLRASGVVDPLHLGRRDARGAPAGRFK